MAEACLKWDEDTEGINGIGSSTWSTTNFTWNDCLILEELIQNGALDHRYTEWFNNWQNKNEEKKKRFITLLTEIEGTEYFNERELKDGKIMLTARDINVLADHMRNCGIEVRVKNIEIS